MPEPKPTIYLIAGCNGAGKTTFAKEFLPHEVKCLRFYNADELARGLSPLDLAAAAIKAGLFLLRNSRIDWPQSNLRESTLSGKTHIRILRGALRQTTRSNCITYGWLRQRRPSHVCANASAREVITSL